ncbi:DUF3854 domain-containing protein [Deinococcus pimensis]|uniref:DUF3854 domain-containing protein n=1 Tax=Deinococcus pimensis TaxID=309888 RepID=UPI0004B96290|nr:DUF3854 domain-containing protein [Deinococcus pimensis]
MTYIDMRSLQAGAFPLNQHDRSAPQQTGGRLASGFDGRSWKTQGASPYPQRDTIKGISESPGSGRNLIPLTLDAAHEEHLRESAISAGIITERGYLTTFGPVPIKEREPRFGKAQLPKKSGGLLIPVYRLGNPKPYAWVMRPDKPRVRENGKTVKYEWPSGVPAVLDVLPRYRDALRDLHIPIWITEGAKKADALATAFGSDIVPMNINGVYGWRTRVDDFSKATASLSDLEEIPWQGRQVVLAFDSDVRYNRSVRDALIRFARVLATKGAEVLMLVLPQEKGGEKLGVDDFLAQGYAATELHTYLQSVTEAAVVGRERFGRHPDTQEDLYFPARWVNAHNAIALEERGRVEVVYPGRLVVCAVGVDVATDIESLEVRFDVGNRIVSVVAPRAELATRKGVIAHLAARGAHVHEGNAAKIARFITEFTAENQGVLPRRLFSHRLGNLPDGTLVAPSAAIGGEVKYLGRHAGHVGEDPEACLTVLREVATWRGAWPLWAALGFSLAAPYMGRLHVRRNPVMYIAGDSNTGKTSVAYFALSSWATPGMAPFVMQGIRTTEAGIAQNLEELGGLPALLDEAHTVRDPERLEGVVYAFANGQTYTRGGRDGQVRGGTSLSGALLLVGEAIAEFKHAGSRNRVLYVDADSAPPLGEEATRGSLIGDYRAVLLEEAWKQGSGHLGPWVARQVLGQWEAFVDTVKQLRGAEQFKPLKDYAEATAVLFATLSVLFEALDMEIPADVALLPERLAVSLATSRAERPAHLAAWENITTMILQAEREGGRSGETLLMLRGELIGWEDGRYVYIATDTPAYKDRVGRDAAQLHGRRWAEQGWIKPDAKQRSTVEKRCRSRGGLKSRTLCILLDVLEAGTAD